MFPCTHLLFVALPLSVWLDLGWTQDEEDFKIFKDSVGCEANQHWFSHYLYYWTKDNSDPDRMFYVPTSASFAACRLECLADKFCRSFVHCQPSVTSKCDSSTRCQKHRFGCPEAEVDPTRFYKKKEVGFSFYQKYQELRGYRSYDMTVCADWYAGVNQYQETRWESLWSIKACEIKCSRYPNCKGFYSEVNVNVRQSWGCCIRGEKETYPCRLYLGEFCPPDKREVNYGILYEKIPINMSDPNILLELDLKHFSERMIPLSNLVCFEFLNTDRPRVNEYDVEDLLEKVDEYFDSKFLLQSTHESALQCAKACLKNPYCFTFVFCVNPECEDEDKPNCFKFSHYCPNIPAYYEYRVGLQTYIRLPEPMEGYELHSLKQINSIKVQPYWTSQDSDLDNCRVQCEASLICESFLYSPTYLGGMLSGNCGLYDRSCQECIDPGRQFFYIKIRSQVEMEVPPNYGVTAKGNVNNVTAADQVIEELVGYDLFENAKCQMSDPAAEKLLANSNGTAKYCADQCDLVPTCRGFVFFTGTPEVCRSHYNVCSTVVYTDPEDLSMSLFYNKTENTIWSQDNHTSRVADSDFYDYDEVRTFATPKLSTTTTTTASATVKTIPATTLTTMSSSVVNPLRQMNILIVISLVLI